MDEHRHWLRFGLTAKVKEHIGNGTLGFAISTHI